MNCICLHLHRPIECWDCGTKSGTKTLAGESLSRQDFISAEFVHNYKSQVEDCSS